MQNESISMPSYIFKKGSIIVHYILDFFLILHFNSFTRAILITLTRSHTRLRSVQEIAL
jgi:hypothetical protein